MMGTGIYEQCGIKKAMDKMDHKKRIMLFGMGDVCYSLIDILNAKIIEEFAARGVECDIVQIVGRKGYTEEIPLWFLSLLRRA